MPIYHLNEQGQVRRKILEPMNNQPFQHICRFGTEFRSHRCDFKTPIRVICESNNPAHLASDVAEMIGFHAVNIRPELNGFQGYDCLTFQFNDEGELPVLVEPPTPPRPMRASNWRRSATNMGVSLAGMGAAV